MERNLALRYWGIRKAAGVFTQMRKQETHVAVIDGLMAGSEPLTEGRFSAACFAPAQHQLAV